VPNLNLKGASSTTTLRLFSRLILQLENTLLREARLSTMALTRRVSLARQRVEEAEEEDTRLRALLNEAIGHELDAWHRQHDYANRIGSERE
jgi:hypothetical protein